MPLGHHALLAVPQTTDGGHVSTSRFVRGDVLPTPFETPSSGGYSRLQPGRSFHSLRRVALGYVIDGERYGNIAQMPPREGFDDLVMLTASPSLEFAWTAVTFPRDGYVWFALRDPRVLRQTILWMSNHGRHYPPWNGRYGPVLGVEDVTAFFHYGLAESARPNALTRRGIPTTVMLRKNRPTAVHYIMGVAPIPRDFGPVEEIRRDADGITLRSKRGAAVCARLDVDFLQTGTVAS